MHEYLYLGTLRSSKNVFGTFSGCHSAAKERRRERERERASQGKRKRERERGRTMRRREARKK